jgi:WhiB family redox-sensing transcriptional regulator
MSRTKKPTKRQNVTIVHVKDPLCSQTDPEIFFPSENKGEGYTTSRYAKSICAECDYTVQCLITALMNKEEHGIWGGSTVRERRSIKTKAQAVEFVRKLRANAEGAKKEGK